MMREQLRNIVNMLKKQVQENLELIRKNEELVRTILNEPVSDGRSLRLENKYKLNKEMLDENNDSIKLQFNIIKFLEKYGNNLNDNKIGNKINDIVNSEISDDEPKYTKQEYFLMTIKGDIVFDSLHPYYNDNEFKNDLLEHYIESEEYEKCEQIKSSN